MDSARFVREGMAYLATHAGGVRMAKMKLDIRNPKFALLTNDF
jgi:hypothetical protein